jgi:hypothetical protein
VGALRDIGCLGVRVRNVCTGVALEIVVHVAVGHHERGACAHVIRDNLSADVRHSDVGPYGVSDLNIFIVTRLRPADLNLVVGLPELLKLVRRIDVATPTTVRALGVTAPSCRIPLPALNETPVVCDEGVRVFVNPSVTADDVEHTSGEAAGRKIVIPHATLHLDA